MAIHVLPILKALAPLIINSTTIAGGLRSIRSGGKLEERIQCLETETIRIAEVLPGVVKQVQAVAEQLRMQEEFNTAMEKRVRLALTLAWVAVGASVAALIMVLT